LSKNC